MTLITRRRRCGDVGVHKPPLGAPPVWLSARNRIGELAGAIERTAEDPLGSIDEIRRWASEICMQCDILRWDENNRKGKCIDN